MAEMQFDSSFQHQVLLMCATKFIHCLDSFANHSRCMSNLIFLDSVQAVMTNTTCFLSKFVMFLKYTPFSRTYCIKLILHQRFFSPDIINYYFDNFAGRVKWFLGLNPLVCFSADFFLFTEAIHFQFWITLFFNLHTSACLTELKPTLRNASSGSASHLETSHVSKLKGSIDRLLDIF